MKTITKEQLKEFLGKHKLWLEGKEGGERADFSYHDLSRTNLRGVNLRGANLSSSDLSYSDLSGALLKNTVLENKSIAQFQFNKHTAYYYGQDEIIIGCERHSVSKWLLSYKEIGEDNGYSEEEIKRYYKFIESCAKDYKENNK